ncbi:MAG TPA: glycosyltransferase family 39 protein [Phototrophicaceae bacterium]|nr:glycosyltransferase family 39 protein [Phototrophicaceae bacterium]
MMSTSTFPLRLSYRDMVIGVAIMLLAFGLRVVVVFDRAARDSAFDPLPDGTDQQAYVWQAGSYEAGNWPRGVFFFQPGLVYYLIGIRALVGHSLGMMRLVTSLTGALACGFTVGAGWLLTKRRWGGYLAGLLLAFYPVTILFSTDFLTESLATFYVALSLFLVLWQREKLAVWRSALIGLTFGLIAITRSNISIMLFAWLLLLILDTRRIRPVIIHGAVSLVFMALMISPITLYNRYAARGGSFPLITDAGSNQIYLANSRDATGVGSIDPAMLTVDSNYLDALLYDIHLNPQRFIELQIRKAGLYWTEMESGNNLDYLKNGEAVSPLLRAIPLDFRMLTFLGWLGVLALIYSNWKGGVFFAAVHLLLYAVVIPLWAEGRLKQPAVVPLILTAAYLGLALYDLARARQWRQLARRYAVPAAVTALVLVGLRWSVDNLPQTRPVASVPADVRPLNVVFDNKLRLIGWRPLSFWPAAERGWTHFLHSYVVQLYWEVLEPVPADYNFYLAYIADGTRVVGFDRAIGGVSFYPRPTSRWQPGEIYAEISGFKLPPDSPQEHTGEIRLGVYKLAGDAEGNRTVLPVQATSPEADSITLSRLAVFDMGYQGTRLDGYSAADAGFGGQIALKGLKMPETARPSQTVTLAFYWSALAEMTTDYTLFVHLVDEKGNLAAQIDTQPRGNMLLTSTWPPDYPIDDEVTLTLPEPPGTYTVYIGWYNSQSPTFDRLPVAGSPDGRFKLGEIHVTP